MKSFIVFHLVQFTDGMSFLNLTNTCKSLQVYQNAFLKYVWQHRMVDNIKNAIYVEYKLNTWKPSNILQEVPNRDIMANTLSALKVLLTKRQMRTLREFMVGIHGHTLIPRGTIMQAKCILGKRSRTNI